MPRHVRATLTRDIIAAAVIAILTAAATLAVVLSIAGDAQ